MYRTSTPETLTLKHELEERGIIVLAEFYDGHKHIDLVIPRARLNIEVDGRQHYEDPFQILRDLSRMHYSEMRGYGTIHVPNEFVKSTERLSKIADALAATAEMRAKRLGHRFHYTHLRSRTPSMN